MSKSCRLRRILSAIGCAFWLISGAGFAQTEGGDADETSCQREAETRNRFGPQEEALADAERCAEAVKRRAGAGHTDYGVALYNLTDLLAIPSVKRGPEAVALNRTARAIFEKAAGAEPGNPVWARHFIKICERLTLAGDEPAANMEKAVLAVRRMESGKLLAPWERGWPSELERDLSRATALQFVKLNQFVEALPVAERFVRSTEQDEAADGPSRDGTARALNGVAWIALMARQPKKALEAADRALALAPGKNWMALNRAHALLFLDQTEEARALYLKYKGEIAYDPGAGGSLGQKRSPQEKWEIAAAWDFAQFREAGLDRPLMNEIEAALRVTDSPLVALRQARELSAEGKTTEALARYQGYIEKAKARFGETSIQHASLLQNFAVRLPELGRPDMVEEVSRRALAILEDLANAAPKKTVAQPGAQPAAQAAPARPAVDELKLADSLLMLAGVYEKGGRAKEAEPLAARALDLCEKSTRADQEALTCLTRSVEILVHVYARANRQADAEHVLKRAIATGEKKWGAEHPNVARLLHEEQSILAPAERSAIEDRIVKILDTAITAKRADGDFEAMVKDQRLGELARRYVKDGQHGNAERALKLVIRGTGAASACESLLDFYKSVGRHAEVEAYYNAVSLEEDRFKSPTGCSGRSLDVLQSAEKFYRERQNAGEAARYQRLLVAARERRLYNWNHEWTASLANDLDQLARLYGREGRTEDAEAALKQAQALTSRREVSEAPAQEAVALQPQQPQPQPPAAEAAPPKVETKTPEQLLLAGHEAYGRGEWNAAMDLYQQALETPRAGSGGGSFEDGASSWEQDPRMAFIRASRKGFESGGKMAAEFAGRAFMMAQRAQNAEGQDALSVARTQELLAADETAVLFLTTPEKDVDAALVWAVAKSAVTWERIEFGPKGSRQSLQNRASMMRPASDGAGSLSQERLLLLAIKDPGGDRASLARGQTGGDTERSQAGAESDLERTLFGSIRDAVSGKSLLIVADGPMNQFPFQSLAKGKGVNVVPSIASLSPARRAKSAKASGGASEGNGR